jgi:hypothetical protein
MSEFNQCRASGCFRRLRDGMVFCIEHWDALPRDLRDGIYAAKRKPEKHAGAEMAAVAWLAAHRVSITMETTVCASAGPNSTKY